MSIRKCGRRWFLMGAGGALAIPALPSLLTRDATAQEPATPKRMVTFMTGHGGIWQNDIFPDAALAD
ncbi:MAG: hypothetical protein AAF411_24315, partial [Myxococcota bacterium]